MAGGVVLIPTAVGYTLAALERGVPKMDALKGRGAGKPQGVLGCPEVYRAVFGREVPGALPPYLCVGFIGQSAAPVPASCVSSDGVGVWLNLGPVGDRVEIE